MQLCEKTKLKVSGGKKKITSSRNVSAMEDLFEEIYQV